MVLTEIEIGIGRVGRIDVQDILSGCFNPFGRYRDEFEDESLDSAGSFQIEI